MPRWRDPTNTERHARYWANIRRRGGVRLDLWVPSERDAAIIRRLVTRMKARAATTKTPAE